MNSRLAWALAIGVILMASPASARPMGGMMHGGGPHFGGGQHFGGGSFTGQHIGGGFVRQRGYRGGYGGYSADPCVVWTYNGWINVCTGQYDD